MSAPWEIRYSHVAGAAVVQPVGELTTATAPRLREALLKHTVEEPRGVVVDLTQLAVTHHSLLTVVPAVWSRTRLWPGVPFSVVLAHASDRARVALRAVPTYASVEDAVANLDELPLRLRAHTELPATSASAGAARRFVTQTCQRWPVELAAETVDVAVLIANEMVENTIRHTPVPDVRLRLEWTGKWLHIACYDDDLQPAVLREPREPRDTFRGLHMIADLSHTWGCSPNLSGGKVVWATLGVGGGH